MKMWLVVAWLAVWASQAEGQSLRLIGTADARHRTVSSLLVSAGCNPLWLSKAVADSKIAASAANSLPRGRRVVLDTPACEATPPASVANESRKIMARSAPAQRATGSQSVPMRNERIEALENEAAKLKGEVTRQQERAEQYRLESDRLIGLNTRLNDQLAEARKPKPGFWARLTGWWPAWPQWSGRAIIIIALSLVALAIVALGITTFKRRRRDKHRYTSRADPNLKV